MNSNQTHQELINHLTHTTQLTPNQAHRLLDEVLAYFNEPIELFVQRRHQQLQDSGYKNVDIFSIIEQELISSRFPAPSLSIRQLRRLIYG
ncbi:MAG: hypothetical protein GKR96_14305 [Gammaproteobacteria bacterium]|nr:hypothetical protein [Gammaproteobacteria bacterium]